MNGDGMKRRGKPRVLLVEDDPVSRAFMREALAGTAEIVAAACGAAARAAVRDTPGFALWLLDAHLGDGEGGALLRALRRHAPDTPALAHTADSDPEVARQLLAAGFREVLLKPLAPGALRDAVTRTLGDDAHAVAEAAPPPWQPLLEVRFREELPAQRAALHAALVRGDHGAALAVLHRLRGSCALVGAGTLDAAVRALQARPGSASALAAFERAVAAALGVEDAAEVGQQVP